MGGSARPSSARQLHPQTSTSAHSASAVHGPVLWAAAGAAGTQPADPSAVTASTVASTASNGGAGEAAA